jgi:hypothetical protein
MATVGRQQTQTDKRLGRRNRRRIEILGDVPPLIHSACASSRLSRRKPWRVPRRRIIDRGAAEIGRLQRPADAFFETANAEKIAARRGVVFSGDVRGIPAAETRSAGTVLFKPMLHRSHMFTFAHFCRNESTISA